MGLLFEHQPSTFDILVKNFFNSDQDFNPLTASKLAHPANVYETDEGLIFEIACTGIPKDEIEITTQDNILRVQYNKKESPSIPSGRRTLYVGLSKRSFNLGWKITARYDLSKAEAVFENGLLTVKVPPMKGSEPRTVKIK